MADGRAKLQWAQTARVLEFLYNANKTSDAEPAQPDTFNPYSPRAKEPDEIVYVTSDLSFLKPLCVQGKSTSNS